MTAMRYTPKAVGNHTVTLTPSTNNGTVRNVAMSNAVVSANQGVGALIGLNMGSVYNSYAAGSVTGPGGYVGGLIGAIFDGTLTRLHFDGTVNSQGNNVGGLTGYLAYQITVVNSYANATVTNTAGVWTGGLVGQNDYGYIVDSHAGGSVIGKGDTGGLVGNNNSGRVTGSYATATVTGTTNTGGLVGNNNNGKVSGSYASGAVTGTTPRRAVVVIGSLAITCVGCSVGMAASTGWPLMARMRSSRISEASW